MTILAGLVMLGVLVVVHEFGHFVVAKMFRIGVPVFSVGMGPRIAGFHWRGTDYRLSALPVGGYVRMAGADPFGEEDPDSYIDPDEDFMKKPVWQRLLVMLAGPAFNLALPFLLFTAVLMLGEPQPDRSVGTVMPGSIAEQVGVEPGDAILSIDGAPVEVWHDVVDSFLVVRSEPVDLLVERDGQQMTIVFPTHDVPLTKDGEPDLEAVGLNSFRMSTRIGVDDPGSPAAQAGLRTGDAITAVNGEKVGTWYELQDALAAGGTHQLDVLRGDQETREIEELELTLGPDPAWTPREGDPAVDAYGLVPAVLFVGGVGDEVPAQLAGVKPDDRILRVDGNVVRSWKDLTDYVGATADEYHAGAEPRSLALEVVRGGELLTLHFAPKMDKDIVAGEVHWRPIMGIERYPEAFVPGPTVKKYYTFGEAFPRAVDETWFLVTATMSMLGNLLTNEVAIQESLGGPIEIFRMAGAGAERGIYSFARLIGMISVSLGIFNLLPVPVLDGGQILFYSIEGIRGRPLSMALREKLQMAGVLALVALMLVVAVMDVNRWLTGG